MISIQNLRKSFDGRRAVNNLSFEARDGAITGLLGANGAGKTTTLRMICGALRPDAGSILVDGIAENPQSRLGALLDHTGIYARLTARENIEYFGKLRGMTPHALDARIEEIICELDLRSIAGRRTAGFSQGERMKTALGRAILHSPRNLLLDEPTNGLDVPTVRSLRDLLRRLRDAGVCIMFSSHVLDEVRTLCDQVVVISEGSLVGQGTPADLCAQTNTASLEEAFVKLTSLHMEAYVE
ncbi:MAG TPA: ATP-binding cassette domain-containing protein [Bryobacteraceae bacterium]|nr:ATP-binding cassette domain-containing protein [Bryobacteraceae bacterium]